METTAESGSKKAHRAQLKPARLLSRSRNNQIFPHSAKAHTHNASVDSQRLEFLRDGPDALRAKSCIPPELGNRTASPFRRARTSLDLDYFRTKPEIRRQRSEGSLETYYRKLRGDKRESMKRNGSISSSTSRARRLSRDSSSGSIETGQRRDRTGSGQSWRLSKGPGLVKLSGANFKLDFKEVKDDDNDVEREKRLREKFRRAIRMVQIFSAFCIGIRRYAEQEKSTQYDLYYMRDMLPGNEDVPTPVQESSLYFNKHLFSRNNTLHFPLWARWTCCLAPEDRKEAEISKLVSLLRGMKSFNKFSREAQLKLCRTMTYACYERRRIIVRQGHPGFCFYFIVSGTVSVTVTRRDFKTGISVTSTVDVLEKNESFGEIALMSEDARRTATIVCRDRVEVLIVNRETVMEHCPDVFQTEFREKYNVIQSHKLFHGWDDHALTQLCFESHIKELAHGKLVDADTKLSDAVYFIIRGKVEMLRRLDLTNLNNSHTSIKLYGSRELPQPESTAHARGKQEYVNIGSLYKGEAWDLQTLFPDATDVPGSILVSAGARLLKVPKIRILQLCSKGEIEEFQKNYIPQHICPSNDALYEKFLAAQSWIEYRKKVVQNVVDFKNGRLIAHVPSSAKGTSGWGAWPGRQAKTTCATTQMTKIPDVVVKEIK